MRLQHQKNVAIKVLNLIHCNLRKNIVGQIFEEHSCLVGTNFLYTMVFRCLPIKPVCHSHLSEHWHLQASGKPSFCLPDGNISIGDHYPD